MSLKIIKQELIDLEISESQEMDFPEAVRTLSMVSKIIILCCEMLKRWTGALFDRKLDRIIKAAQIVGGTSDILGQFKK